MTKRRIWLVAIFFFAVSCYALLLQALPVEEYKTEDEEAKAYNVTRTVKTVNGLSFVVQEDRPIEKIAGVYRPIDLDSYVALKFGRLEKKMQDFFDALSKKIEELTRRVEVLEAKEQRNPAPDSSSAKPAASPSS